MNEAYAIHPGEFQALFENDLLRDNEYFSGIDNHMEFLSELAANDNSLDLVRSEELLGEPFHERFVQLGDAVGGLGYSLTPVAKGISLFPNFDRIKATIERVKGDTREVMSLDTLPIESRAQNILEYMKSREGALFTTIELTLVSGISTERNLPRTMEYIDRDERCGSFQLLKRGRFIYGTEQENLESLERFKNNPIYTRQLFSRGSNRLKLFDRFVDSGTKPIDVGKDESSCLSGIRKTLRLIGSRRTIISVPGAQFIYKTPDEGSGIPNTQKSETQEYKLLSYFQKRRGEIIHSSDLGEFPNSPATIQRIKPQLVTEEIESIRTRMGVYIFGDEKERELGKKRLNTDISQTRLLFIPGSRSQRFFDIITKNPNIITMNSELGDFQNSKNIITPMNTLFIELGLDRRIITLSVGNKDFHYHGSSEIEGMEQLKIFARSRVEESLRYLLDGSPKLQKLFDFFLKRGGEVIPVADIPGRSDRLEDATMKINEILRLIAPLCRINIIRQGGKRYFVFEGDFPPREVYRGDGGDYFFGTSAGYQEFLLLNPKFLEDKKTTRISKKGAKKEPNEGGVLFDILNYLRDYPVEEVSIDELGLIFEKQNIHYLIVQLSNVLHKKLKGEYGNLTISTESGVCVYYPNGE